MATDGLAASALEAVEEESPQEVAELLTRLEGHVRSESDAIVLDYLANWSEQNNYEGLSQRADDIASNASRTSYSARDFLAYGGFASVLNVAGFEAIDYISSSEPFLADLDMFGLLLGGVTGLVLSRGQETYDGTEEFLYKSNSNTDFFLYKEKVSEIKDELRSEYSREI